MSFYCIKIKRTFINPNKLSIMNWYLKCLRQYFDFSGRARRKEYWMFYLFNLIFAFIFGAMDGLIGWASNVGIGVLGAIYCAGTFIPGLAVTVRRMHDIGKSGWSLLLILIPIVGPIILLIRYCKEGESGSNSWGSNPKMN